MLAYFTIGGFYFRLFNLVVQANAILYPDANLEFGYFEILWIDKPLLQLN